MLFFLSQNFDHVKALNEIQNENGVDTVLEPTLELNDLALTELLHKNYESNQGKHSKRAGQTARQGRCATIFRRKKKQNSTDIQSAASQPSTKITIVVRIDENELC